MKAGTRLPGGLLVGEPQRGGPEWLLFAAEDATKTPLELVVPMTHALLRPGVAAGIQGFTPPNLPGFLPCAAPIIHEGVPLLLRPATHPLPPALSGEEALAVAATLSRYLQQAEGVLGGHLDVSDIRYTLEGDLVLALVGIPPKSDLLGPPLPGLAGDLAALAHVLKRISLPGNVTLDSLLVELLSNDVARILAAGVHLSALPGAARRPQLPVAVQETSISPLPLGTPDFYIVVPRKGLSATALKHVAFESGIALQDLQGGGVPSLYVVEGAHSPAEAQRALARLKRRGVNAVSLRSLPPPMWPTLSVLFGLVAGFFMSPVNASLEMLGIAGSEGLLGIWIPLLIQILLGCVGLLATANAVKLWWLSQQQQEAQRAWEQRGRLVARNESDPLSAKISRLRDELPLLGLPDLMVEDLRHLLADFSESLEDARVAGRETEARVAVENLLTAILHRLKAQDLEAVARLIRNSGQVTLLPTENNFLGS